MRLLAVEAAVPLIPLSVDEAVFLLLSALPLLLKPLRKILRMLL